MSICGASPDHRAQWRAIAIKTRGYNGINTLTSQMPWAELTTNYSDFETDIDYCRYVVEGYPDDERITEMPQGHKVRYNYIWRLSDGAGSPVSFLLKHVGTLDEDGAPLGEEGRRRNRMETVYSAMFTGALRQPHLFYINLRIQDFASNCHPIPLGERLGADNEEGPPGNNPKLEVDVPVVLYPRVVLPDIPEDWQFSGNAIVDLELTANGLLTHLRRGPHYPSNPLPVKPIMKYNGSLLASYFWSRPRHVQFTNMGLNSWQECERLLEGSVDMSMEFSITSGYEVTAGFSEVIEASGSLNFAETTTKSNSVSKSVSIPGYPFIRSKVDGHHLTAYVELDGALRVWNSNFSFWIPNADLTSNNNQPRFFVVPLDEFTFAHLFEHCNGANPCASSSHFFVPYY